MIAERRTNDATIRAWQESSTPGACGDLFVSCRTHRTTRLLLADASGHGPAAAEVAGTFKKIVGNDLAESVSQSVFARWNRELFNRLPDTGFVAVTVIEVDHATGRVQVWNAGNPAPLWLRRAEGRTEAIGQYGMALGMLPSPGYEPPTPQVIHPQAGDAVLAFSDGLTDQPNSRERFGDCELGRSLTDALRWGTDAIATLRQVMTNFLQDARLVDDLTAIELTWAENAPVEPAPDQVAA